MITPAPHPAPLPPQPDQPWTTATLLGVLASVRLTLADYRAGETDGDLSERLFDLDQAYRRLDPAWEA